MGTADSADNFLRVHKPKTNPVLHSRGRVCLLWQYPHAVHVFRILSVIMGAMRFKLSLLFGWGIAIYAVMFFLWSLFITYGFVEGFLPRVIGLFALIVVTFFAGRSLRASTWRDILPYSLGWGVLMAVFDGITSVPYAGWSIYTDWAIWFMYAAVVVGPLLALYPHFKRFSSSSPRV